MATTKTNPQSTEEQSAAERAKQEAGRVGETAKHEAGQVIEDAKQQSRELLTGAADRMKQEAQGQTQRASENLRAMSSDFRTMAESSQGQGTAASLVRMGAERMESVADRLDSGGLEGVMRDVGDFARRNPTTFLTVTFGAGLLAGRLVKNMDMERVASGSPQTGASPHPAAADLSSNIQQPEAESRRPDTEASVGVGS